MILKQNLIGLLRFGSVAMLLALLPFHVAQGASDTALLSLPELSLDRFEPGVRDAIRDGIERVKQTQDLPDPRRAGSYGQLGMLLHAHDLLAAAKPCYVNASLLAPNDYRWPYLIGQIFQLDGEPAKAAAQYRAALGLNADYLPAMIHLGHVLIEQENNDAATAAFSTALETSPDNAAALAGLGNIAYRRGEFEQAVKLFHRAMEQDPEATRLNHMLGMSYRRLGDLDKARLHLARRGNRNPVITDPVLAAMQTSLSNSQGHIRKGLEAYNAGRYGDASREYRLALESAPSDIDTRLALAWVLELEGNDDVALREVEKVLNIDAQSAKAHYLKGALLAKSESNREALTHLRMAVSLEPDSATPRLLLATTLMRSGKHAEAEEHYAELAARQSSDAVLLYRLGVARLAAGRCQQAIMPLENALRIRSNSLAVMQALLRAYSICPDDSAGHSETALNQAQRVFDQIKRWDSAETLAMALAANQRFGEAAQLQQTVIEEARRSGESVAIIKSLSRNLNRYLDQKPADRAWPPESDVYHPPVLSAQDRLALDG